MAWRRHGREDAKTCGSRPRVRARLDALARPEDSFPHCIRRTLTQEHVIVKYVIVAIVLFVVGVALTQVERESNVFTPVIRIRTESGLFLTMVQRQTTKRSACSE